MQLRNDGFVRIRGHNQVWVYQLVVKYEKKRQHSCLIFKSQKQKYFKFFQKFHTLYQDADRFKYSNKIQVSNVENISLSMYTFYIKFDISHQTKQESKSIKLLLPPNHLWMGKKIYLYHFYSLDINGNNKAFRRFQNHKIWIRITLFICSFIWNI